MSLTEAIAYLRRYQKWRRECRGQSLTQGGFSNEYISQAIDLVLNAADQAHVVQEKLNSTSSRLRKCIIQREQFHSQLRSKSNPP